MLASTIRRTLWSPAIFACLAAVLISVAAARATEPQSQPATKPAAQPTSAPSNPEAHQKAKAVVEAALAKYRAAKTYQDKLEARTDFVATDKEGKDLGQSDEFAATLFFAAPNRVVLDAEDYSIHCDGKKLWLFAGALDQYTEKPAPERIDYAALAEQIMVDDPPHPLLFVLSQPDKKFEELFPMVREFTGVTREERDGRPGQRIAGLFDATDTPFGFGSELVPFTLWFDEKSGLLGELKIDVTAAVRKGLGLTGEKKEAPEEAEEPGQPHKVDRADVTIAFKDVKLDAEIPADRFEFTPDRSTKKVAEFDWETAMQMPDPADLIGQPAPPFSGDAFDGKPLSLESLRGRVVVLDFWATWCVPCVKALPDVQKLSEKYADKPVTVIGINQDAKAAEKKVKDFIATKKLTFRQFPDVGGKIGRSYKVAAIPCTFLIDTKGVVQAVHVGLEPGKSEEFGKQLSEQIDKLLKGENLFDPEKLAKERKERESGKEPKNPLKEPPREQPKTPTAPRN